MTLPAAYFDGDGDSNRLDQPSDHHDKHASWQTDSSGNVTGLVGPDGSNISISSLDLAGTPRELLTGWDWPASLQNQYDYLSTLTPTKYFDPDASNSANTGTLADPYNSVATLSAYISGSIPGAIIGFKRGTKTRGAITGANMTGTAVSPVIFCPYGDAQEMPEITGLIVATGWTQYSGDIWQRALTTDSDVFENGVRLPRATGGDLATIIAAMQAASPGVMGWISSVVYVRTSDGASPNGGQLEVNNVASTVDITYPNSAGCGNIIIAGLKFSGGRIGSLFIHCNNGAANAPSFVHVIGNVFTQSGVLSATGSSADGLLINGVTDAIRMTDCVISGNYFTDTANNAIEVNGINSSVIEYNEASDYGGNMLEMYSSCSSNNVRFNRGLGSKINLYGSNYLRGGIWIGAFELLSTGGAQADTSNDASLSNIIHHNLIVDGVSSCLQVDTGHSNLIHNNTIIAHISQTSSHVKMSSPHATGNTLTNNAFLSYGNNPHVWYKSTCTLLSGDNNFYGSINGRAFKSTYVHSNSVVQASLVNHKAECQTQYPGFDQNALGGDPRVSTRGVPLPGSPLLGAGKTGLGYTRDINGVPIAETPSIGCFEL